MYGLRSINNIYVSDGMGRDSNIVRNPDFRAGRDLAPSCGVSSFRGTMCHPRERRCVPKPPNAARIDTLYRGKHPPKRTTPVPRAHSLPQLLHSWSKQPGALAATKLGGDKREGVEPLEGWASGNSWSPTMAKEVAALFIRRHNAPPPVGFAATC
eukprot:TRINITY_DN24238_c0_g1_i1.p2 TRINITY_DN24238_c0_g1~~TRINITY_DN24238_c0_g1_i1.p2  ORF type:complete len:155 (-),score=31.67 TRINITY_DN24238_c0_g1_i1:209-673(-)